MHFTGAAAAIRAFSKKVSRVVYPLSTNTGSARHKCTSGSLAPARVRAMFNLKFKEQNQDTCKKSLGLQAVIMNAKGPGDFLNEPVCELSLWFLLCRSL